MVWKFNPIKIAYSVWLDTTLDFWRRVAKAKPIRRASELWKGLSRTEQETAGVWPGGWLTLLSNNTWLLITRDKNTGNAPELRDQTLRDLSASLVGRANFPTDDPLVLEIDCEQVFARSLLKLPLAPLECKGITAFEYLCCYIFVRLSNYRGVREVTPRATRQGLNRLRIGPSKDASKELTKLLEAVAAANTELPTLVFTNFEGLVNESETGFLAALRDWPGRYLLSAVWILCHESGDQVDKLLKLEDHAGAKQSTFLNYFEKVDEGMYADLVKYPSALESENDGSSEDEES